METEKKTPQFHTVLFIVLFMGMLIVPALLLNTTEPLVSELENRAMTVWPGLGFDKEHMDWYGHYVEDRVGFRNTAIAFNNAVSFHVFHTFDEDVHMYGKEDYIFPADSGYIRNYQRLDQPTKLMDDLCLYLSRSAAYGEKNGASFYVMVCPNKSSVYGDYMPDDIHVNTQNRPLLDLLKERFNEAGLSYVIPDEEFARLRKQEQIYNVAYDCAHWNDLGAKHALMLLDERIQEDHPEIPLMDPADLSITYEKKQLDFFSEPYPESVPVMTLKSDSVPMESVDVTTKEGAAMAAYRNPDAKTKETMLLLHDSFLDGKEVWWTSRYRAVYSCSRNNYEHLQEYIDVLHPDVIVFEVAERAFMDDLHAYTALRDVTYP